MDKDCSLCKFKKKFVWENGFEFLNICTALEFEESEEGFLLAPEVSEFDAEHCLLFKPRH